MGVVALFVLILTGVGFGVLTIFLSKILIRHSTNPQKGTAYECGIPTSGSPWHQFNIGYYMFTLVFLVFDVELIFLFPWAVVASRIGIIALVEIVIFMFILFMGLIYAHKKGALKWM